MKPLKESILDPNLATRKDKDMDAAKEIIKFIRTLPAPNYTEDWTSTTGDWRFDWHDEPRIILMEKRFTEFLQGLGDKYGTIINNFKYGRDDDTLPSCGLCFQIKNHRVESIVIFNRKKNTGIHAQFWNTRKRRQFRTEPHEGRRHFRIEADDDFLWNIECFVDEAARTSNLENPVLIPLNGVPIEQMVFKELQKIASSTFEPK